MHRQHRVGQVRQADAVGLGDQPEQGAIAVEAPGAALLGDLQAWLVVAVEQFVGEPAGRCLVGQFQGLGAEPLDRDDRDQAVRQDAAHGGTGEELFQSCHRRGTVWLSGGGGEIRTHERLPVAGFQDRCNRPLCHTSEPALPVLAPAALRA